MLKAEQIPDEVARLADEAYYDIAGDNPTMSDDDIMKHAIAAAIIAWPGMLLKLDGRYALLRLPQENKNG